MRLVAAALLATAAVLWPLAAAAERQPVLQQVDLPHSYYWRELYLPQLTTGPSSAAFMPAGDELIYSMAGSLWRQRIGSGEAIELTHESAAYDYQPDVAPDGGSVVYARYDGRALELWRLDLASGRQAALTANGGVNVEPRLSPDGRQLVWVSTAGTGHFNLMIADLGAAGLANIRPLIAPRRSTVNRYYYSAFDHAINPSWSPDGQRVFFVGNPEVAWGSGSIRSVPVADPAATAELPGFEETSWAARPEVAPDGRRLLYSSYRGRQWHQLWLTTVEGAAPLPLTFGEFDRRNARWSPDGERLLYISNEKGNTDLQVMELTGGAITEIRAATRRHLQPRARLVLQVRDAAGGAVPARVAILGSDQRWQAPADAWMHGDDGYDRALQPSETRYFHCAARCELDLPAGATTLWVQHGFRHLPWRQAIDLQADAERVLPIQLRGSDLPAYYGRFLSADLHVHMNYGGHYRNTPARLADAARAEDLDLAHNLIVNKEQRIPDVAYFGSKDEQPGDGSPLLLHGQEFHTSLWGHLGLLHLKDRLLLPDYSAYQHTALASPWPHNGIVADLAHAQGALVGYVHPFDWEIAPATETTLSHQLPADVANGKVDYLEVVGFSDHRATAGVWYRLLNLGFRLPAGAGTDAMANYASLRGPVGMNRVFLETGGERSAAAARAALQAGRTFASNGPLLGLEVGGKRPGGIVEAASQPLRYRIALRSPVAIDHLELVHNGAVIQSFALAGDRQSLDAEGELGQLSGGWLLLRAWSERSDPLVLDLYPYATTSPVYLALPGAPQSAAADAAYFVAWLDRIIAVAADSPDYNNDRERRDTLGYFSQARRRFVSLQRSTEGKGK